MHVRNSAIFPISFGHALDLAETIGLPGATVFEPCGFAAFLCASAKDAVYFALRFDGEQWRAATPDIFLFEATSPIADEVRVWAEENPRSGQLVEMVAVEFCSASDQQRFEAAL